MIHANVADRLREWARSAARGETKLFNLGFGDHELSQFTGGGRYISSRRHLTEEIIANRKSVFEQLTNLAAQKEGVNFQIADFHPDDSELTYHTQIRVV